MQNYKNTNFWMIPRQLYDLEDLPAKAVLLYGVIYTLANSTADGTAFATVKDYSKFLNCSVQYVYKLIDIMQAYKINSDTTLIAVYEHEDYMEIEPKISNRVRIEKRKNKKNDTMQPVKHTLIQELGESDEHFKARLEIENKRYEEEMKQYQKEYHTQWDEL